MLQCCHPNLKLTEMCCCFSKRKENIQDDGKHSNGNRPSSVIIVMSFLKPTFYRFNFVVILTYFKMSARNCQTFLFQWYRLDSSREWLKTVLKYINLERNISQMIPHKRVFYQVSAPSPHGQPKPNVLENSKPVNFKNFKLNIYVMMYLKLMVLLIGTV